MKRLVLILVLVTCLAPVRTLAARNGGGTATIYRDDFGIPHIYAKTVEAAAYASGYAQAEDRLEEMLKNYRRATGRMAEVFGFSYYGQDAVLRMFRNEEISREHYHEISARSRAGIEAFVAGVHQFEKDHPEQVPKWAQEIHPWDVVALGRYIIFGWPFGECEDILNGSGLKLNPFGYHGSNEMLLAPSRTAMHAPIAIIDPHLSWYDEFRFYEIRVYAGDYKVSGVAILGTPFPTLGHSRWCSVAMTTGGPATSDVYEEEINPDNPLQYRYDGKWKDMTVRTMKIGLSTNGGAVQTNAVKFYYTQHGPILAKKGNLAYAFALPYAEQVGLIDQSTKMFTARNLTEMKRALSDLQLMQQNIMVATVQGDIFYVRVGRCPIRAPGVDPLKPVPGNTSKNEWQGIHPFTDLVQLTNPPQGYMQNCNVTPFEMMKNSPLTPERYAKYPYLYNATRTSPLHQRALEARDALDAAHDVTVDKAIDLAFNPTVWGAETWQSRLKEAWEHENGLSRVKSADADLYNAIRSWNRRCDSDSVGALTYYAFKISLGGDGSKLEPDAAVGDGELIAGLTKAGGWLDGNVGSRSARWGDYFRVGRKGSDKTWPVGGGTLMNAGMATPRAITFSKQGNVMVGHTGQTSTQIVVMSNPPKSWAIIPLGESDHPESGHWDDQAEKLFSKSIAAPTYFMDKAALMKHVTSTRTLTYTPSVAQSAAAR